MKKLFLFSFMVAWSIMVACSIAMAETYDASLFGALKWRSIGPYRGGRSIASAGSASRPNEYYFGAVGGGLWKTVDGGTTWKPVTDGQLQSSSVGAVAVSESNPDVVYIGMGETELRGNMMQGDGGPNAERGVFRTKDGGKTWQKVLYRNDRAGAVDLCMDPLNFPIKLNNQLAALARSIETGDAKSTDASYVVFKELTERLEALKVRLDEALKTNLVQVNDLLTGQQMEKISAAGGQ